MAGKPVGKIIEAVAQGLGYDKQWTSHRLMNWETPRRASRTDPFKSLIGTVLSARTRDENTAQAAASLFAVYDTPEKLAAAPVRKIEKLIKKSGFYRVKAGHVKEISKLLIKQHGSKVPDTMDGLCELPGVGRKVAGCVLVYAFGKNESAYRGYCNNL